MTAYLLDTNIVSDVLRHPHGKAAMRILNAGIDRLRISIVAAAEIRFGLVRRNAAALAAKLDELIGQVIVVPFEAPADIFYAEIRADLERRGKLIGPNDLMIAAHALALDRVLVTDNVREFTRVKG